MWRSTLRLILALTLGLGGALLSLTPFGFVLEDEVALNWLFVWRGPKPAPPDAVVVGLDRASLARFRSLPVDPSEWPSPLQGCHERRGDLMGLRTSSRAEQLPRGLYACLVDELSMLGASVIVFDIAFRERQVSDPTTLDFARAIREHGGVVLVMPVHRQWFFAGADARSAQRAETVMLPELPLVEAAAATAPLTLPHVDSRLNQLWSHGGGAGEEMQLPYKAVEIRAQRAAPAVGGNDASPLALRAIKAWAELPEEPRIHYLNFYGPPGSIPSIGLGELLAPEPPIGGGISTTVVPGMLGKTVFVGRHDLVSADTPDTFYTAFRSEYGVDLSGVEIAATAFDNIMHDEAIRALPEGLRLLLVFAVGSLFGFTALSRSIWPSMRRSAIVAVSYGGSVFVCFAQAGLWLPLFVPIAILYPVALILGLLEHYLGVARLFSFFVPGPVSRKFLSGSAELSHPPEKREVTVMMTDIAGFTSFAEHAEPEAVTHYVNEHFDHLAHIIERENGVLAQFVGDGVMAFWGAPDPQNDHAERACRAALAIERAIKDICPRDEHDDRPSRMRIGLNTGTVIAGLVGARERVEYGIVGDTVNSAQRIEQLGKELCPDTPDVAILVGRRTYRQAAASFEFENVGKQHLRGRERVEEVYRLRGARS